ncbi:MAG TPA: FtsQ-type POTRA domain-containing protein [Magnetospirillaceae bacterium]|jgi:cell division protein FtsQ
MRRLTDVTITTSDRPAPPRSGNARAKATRPNSESRPAPRSRRRRLPTWLRRLIMGTSTAALIAAIGGGATWFMRSARFTALQSSVSGELIALSERAGMRIQDVEVEGRKRVSQQDLITALNIKEGDPILGVDLPAARARIAALPGVATVTIERRLPGELDVLITEREPVAIWQNDGHYQLVDRAGQPAGDNIDAYGALPLVVGPGAPDHVATLLDMLRTEPALLSRVKASEWVSARRWTVQLSGPSGDIDICLPENDPASAWHELAKLQDEQKLLDRKITMVDMRIADRLILRIPGGIEPHAKTPSTHATPTVRHKAPGRDA